MVCAEQQCTNHANPSLRSGAGVKGQANVRQTLRAEEVNMILNHGNIRKSKLLRYIFLDNLPSEDHLKKCQEYHKTIEKEEFTKYLRIEKYLHDSKISIKKDKLNIKIEFSFLNEEIDKDQIKTIIFKNAKVISWNKCRRSGHISRMNKPINPYQYGYSEFYTDNGNKYVSIIVFTKPNCKIKIGVYNPIVTIRYEEMILDA
jgi:hypothetical protein